MRYISRGRQEKDALFFVGGVDTSKVSFMLSEEQYRWAVNAVNAGGVIQTRPGLKTLMTICGEEVNPQFMAAFTPTNGESYVVLGLSGLVYAFPFTGSRQLACGGKLANIQFSDTTPQIYWTQAVRSRSQVNGIKVEIEPTAVLLMQDGYSRAAYWDGASSGHLNPQTLIQSDSDGSTIYPDGWNQTPVGTVMTWSGNRLWVAQGNKVIASDINDPLYFTENLDTDAGGGGISFPNPITAIADRGTSGRNESYVFVWTATSTHTLRSGVFQRSAWASTPDFNKQIFSTVGCIAAKSPIVHQGIMYWYSEDGWQAFDSIDTVTSTQKLPPIDGELIANKVRICPDRSRICSGNRDNYVFCSVPVGETIQALVRNSHTQVLDSAVIDGQDGPLKAWQGIWTGINPVEWATTILDGQAVTLALSLDNDGKVRIWEAFQGNRADNGHEIPWSVETKTHLGSTIFENCKLNYFQALLTNIFGNLKLEAFWKGTRGVYKKMMDAIYTASPGSLFLQSDEINSETVFQEYGPQSRQIVSPVLGLEASNCTSAGVESNQVDNRDIGFSILFKFQGRGAISAYGIRMDAINDNSTGGIDNTEAKVSNVETGLHIKPLQDCPKFVKGEPAFVGQYTLADEPAQNAFNPHSITYVEDKYSAPVDDERCVDLNSLNNCYLNPIVQYKLTVVNGNGSGNYQEGTVVQISANTPEGKQFVSWTGDTQYIQATGLETTFVTMPDQDVTVEATFVEVPAVGTRYTLTVINGSGSGTYSAGEVIVIISDNPEQFQEWIGATTTISDTGAATTTLTMPAEDITVEAVLVPSYTLTVLNGTGSGSYQAGTVVNITSDDPENFIEWVGDVGEVANTNSSSTTVTMPDNNVTVEATFSGGDTYSVTYRHGFGGTVVDSVANLFAGSNVYLKAGTGLFGEEIVPFQRFRWYVAGFDSNPNISNNRICQEKPTVTLENWAEYTVPAANSLVKLNYGQFDFNVTVTYRVENSTGTVDLTGSYPCTTSGADNYTPEPQETGAPPASNEDYALLGITYPTSFDWRLRLEIKNKDGVWVNTGTSFPSIGSPGVNSTYVNLVTTAQTYFGTPERLCDTSKTLEFRFVWRNVP